MKTPSTRANRLFRRLFSSWKTASAGFVAFAIYLLSPAVLRWYDPTAGTFDAGYLQWVLLATALAFWAAFVGWVIFQLAFASLDQSSSNENDEWGNLRGWFNDHMSGFQKWVAVQTAFVLCVILFLVCLKLVPLS